MKILVIGDLHIKHDNGDDIDLLFIEIKKAILENFTTNEPRNIMLLGDVLHTHEKVYTQCLNKALEFITKCTEIAFTYIIVGNHDAITNSIFLTNSHWMNVLKDKKNIQIIDNVFQINNQILAIPYVPVGRFHEALSISNIEWKNKKLIFAHQEFKGCSMGAIISEHGDTWEQSNPMIISGHIHDNQMVGNNIHYIGAPLQHTFGDTTKRVMVIVDVDENHFEKKEIPLSISKKSIMKANLDNSEEIQKMVLKVENLLEKKEKVKIKIENSEDFKRFKKSNEYQKLIKEGVVFQVIKQTQENNQEVFVSNSFPLILEKLVKQDEDTYVSDVYDEIVHNKITLRIN